jgi:hypothetical protein
LRATAKANPRQIAGKHHCPVTLLLNQHPGVKAHFHALGSMYLIGYTERELIILLAGGDKSSQRRDIETAIMLAEDL